MFLFVPVPAGIDQSFVTSFRDAQSLCVRYILSQIWSPRVEADLPHLEGHPTAAVAKKALLSSGIKVKSTKLLLCMVEWSPLVFHRSRIGDGKG